LAFCKHQQHIANLVCKPGAVTPSQNSSNSTFFQPGIKSVGLNTENGNVEWVQYNIDETNLFVQISEEANVDGVPRTIEVATVDNFILFTLPHFWEYAVIDPSIPHTPPPTSPHFTFKLLPY
jgi:hypothetical protein